MTLAYRVNIARLCIGLFFFLIIPPGFCQDESNPIHTFNLDSLYADNEAICRYPVESPSANPSIFFNPDDGNVRFRIPGYDEGVPFQSNTYLVIDVEHENIASLVISLEFVRKGDTINQYGWITPRVSARIGVLPTLPTRVIFPLSYLDAQKVFLPKMPRQLKGTLNGKRMDSWDIDEVYLRFNNAQKRSFQQSAFIMGIYLYDEMPPLLSAQITPIVDSLGQWNARSWRGKSESFDQYKHIMIEAEEAFAEEKWQSGRSEYMGFSSLRFDSTGFFHTYHDGNRWWLVDPSGYAYLSVAPTGVRPFSHCPVEKNEDLFEWLPENKGLFAEAYAKQNGLLSLSYTTINLMRLWGKDYMIKWQEYTANLIRSLGFTGSANWSDVTFYQNAGLPYFYPMRSLPTTKVKLFRDFPDVFAPEFENSVVNYARQLESKNTDPLMIGYFLGNEPHWAFGEFNLAREMLYKNDHSSSRKEFLDWLKLKYKDDPYLLSASWGYEFNDFGDLKNFVLPKDDDITIKAEEDLMEFTSILVDKYAKTICEATKKADPNHLNLGLRFAWISSDACLQTGKYFDVFSLNGYSFPDPPNTQRIVDELQKPVIIGEFHFGAIDRGLPATGLKGVRNQRARGMAYRHYVEQGFARPEIIGLHYFQWNDQPLTGRFDGENYNIGIVDVMSRPYEDLVRQLKRTNKRIFQVASNQVKPYRISPKIIPAIYY